MKIIDWLPAENTNDGAGVKISRVADFSGIRLDPFLMIDQLKSDNSDDFIGGFPDHPHRGIETFTYMIDGAFEHRDQMGNRKKIGPGNVQWMSTGYGVIHSEMPIVEESNGIHGFQIWLNMAASQKMRPAIYQDSEGEVLERASNQQGATLIALAGEWSLGETKISSPLKDLSQDGAIADLIIEPNGRASIFAESAEKLIVMLYQGELFEPNISSPKCLITDPNQALELEASDQGLRALILRGKPLREPVAHWGPFVMNTREELEQAVEDYRAGKLGTISV